MRSRPQNAFATLRSRVPRRQPREHCEVCQVLLPHDHTHLIEPASRQLVCVCEPCAAGVTSEAQLPYRRVPRAVRALPDFRLADEQWDGLMIPVGLAFFFNSSVAGRMVAMYPSPAGPTESLLELAAWNDIVLENPSLPTLQSDVEALLVRRFKEVESYYVVPIDRCYELVGLIRGYWKGLSGGAEVWQQIAYFFDQLREQARA